ncbi:MAG: DoxX family protein [Candidatus Malihini olakiniferum]
MLGLINRVLDKPDAGKLLLRLAFGILLIFHGWHKIVDGVDAIAGMLTNAGLPTFIACGVFAGEVVSPILLILGILTRPSALVVAGTIVVAQFLAAPASFVSLVKTGAWGAEPTAVFFFSALAISMLGSGKYSVMSNPNLR